MITNEKITNRIRKVQLIRFKNTFSKQRGQNKRRKKRAFPLPSVKYSSSAFRTSTYKLKF